MEFETDDKFEAWFADFMAECGKQGYRYPVDQNSIKHYFNTDIPADQAARQFIGMRAI